MHSLRSFLAARWINFAAGAAGVLLPWGYCWAAFNYPIPLLRSTAFNFFVIVCYGVLCALYAHRIRQTFSPKAGKIFLLLFAAGLTLYGFALLTITYYCYTHYIFQSVDLSYYHLTLWQLSQFQIPYIWDSPTTPVWQQHFEPILFFIVPLYWFMKDAGALVIIQAAAVISGAVPLYLAASRAVQSKYIALAISFAYLAFGGLEVGFAYGFHPILFFPPLFFWLYCWYIRKKTVLYFLSVLGCLFVKEEVSLIMMFWGIYLLLFKKEKLLGTGTVVMGALWYILCFHIIFPHFSPNVGFVYWYQYNQVYGSGITGVIKSAFMDPRGFLTTLVTPNYKVDTILCLFGAFAFLPFLYPPSLILVIPSLLEKLLSGGIAALNGTHYTAASAGVTAIASLESLRFIRNKPPGKIPRSTVFWGTFIFSVAFFSNVLYGCATFALVPFRRIITPPRENLTALSEALHSIPHTATVGAQYIIAPHIPKPFGMVTPWPNYLNKPDVIIYDTKLPLVLTDIKNLNNTILTLSKDPEYYLAFNREGVVMFEKTNGK